MPTRNFVAWNHRRADSPGWIIEANGCHTWTGARNSQGYGQVNLGNRRRGIHRVRYEREVGPIPEGMQLDHYVCDGGPRGCCNPLHCRPVTPRENMMRSNSVSSRNRAKTHCPQGHALSDDNLAGYDRKRGNRKCRTCVNERRLAWTRTHPEENKAKKAASYRRNREKVLAKSHDYNRRKSEEREAARALLPPREHWNAKLTFEQVRAIRLDTRPGIVVARELGVSNNTVCRIRQGLIWKHVA